MHSGAAAVHQQAQIEVVLRLIEGIVLEGLVRRVEMVLRPEKRGASPDSQEDQEQHRHRQAAMLPQPAHKGLDRPTQASASDAVD
jgi:hypothetical protein